MLRGEFVDVTPEEAAQGVASAREYRTSGYSPRQLGWGLIKAYPVGTGGDRLPCWVAITDGERDGAVLASIDGSHAAAASNRREDPVEVLMSRVRHMLIPNTGSHFDHVALARELHL
jgi:hypothetical protein